MAFQYGKKDQMVDVQHRQKITLTNIGQSILSVLNSPLICIIIFKSQKWIMI